MMTPREKHNFAELIAVLRTFPFEELCPHGPRETGTAMGHLMGLSYMVLVQRRNVIEALQNHLARQEHETKDRRRTR